MFSGHVDEQVRRVRGRGRKGWLPVFRQATLFKVAYGFGLRRTEARMLDLADFGSNPHATPHAIPAGSPPSWTWPTWIAVQSALAVTARVPSPVTATASIGPVRVGRALMMTDAYVAHPERFVGHPPIPPHLPAG